MYCTNCGRQLEPNAQFCIHCGKKITNSFNHAPHSNHANNQWDVPPTAQPNFYNQQQPLPSKNNNKALPWIIIGSVLGGLLIVIGLVSYMINGSTGGFQDAFSDNNVTVGATFHKNSANLDVSDGQNLQAGQKIYARLETSSRFKASTIKFMIEEKNGSGWVDYASKNISVSPNDSILVAYFVPDHANTYHILFINGSDVLGETTVDVSDGLGGGSNDSPSGGDNL